MPIFGKCFEHLFDYTQVVFFKCIFFIGPLSRNVILPPSVRSHFLAIGLTIYFLIRDHEKIMHACGRGRSGKEHGRVLLLAIACHCVTFPVFAPQ